MTYEWTFESVDASNTLINFDFAANVIGDTTRMALVLMTSMFNLPGRESYDIKAKGAVPSPPVIRNWFSNNQCIGNSLIFIVYLATRTNNQAGYFSRRFRIMTSGSPQAGTCTVTPATGSAYSTRFSVTCTGFVDDDMPISYRVFYVDTPNGKCNHY